ncbi:MAG: branched-chain amino acid transport system II carrier protein [Firmicutes bacterium]|nr:branched-chain amino acid transport system II carrier protein [Bacillota bacterium]
MNKKRISDCMTVGFALFAMFFGAGNLIFPPYLGWESGSSWLVGFLCFITADIGLSLLIMLSTAKTGEGTEGIMKPLGKRAGFLLLTINCLCIGPFIAIPRTASITYEIGLVPVFGQWNSWLCTGVFILVAFLLSIRQSKVIDRIGKVMAPLLFIALLILIVKGFVTPVGEIGPGEETGAVVRNGLLSGYQTLDMMAACVFYIAMEATMKDKGYTTTKEQLHMVAAGGGLSVILLFVVYGGLAYIGATASVQVTEEMTQNSLLLYLTESLMGKPGLILLGVIVAFACLTTAVGLLTSIASYFENTIHIKYEILVTVFAVTSWIISNLGTAVIISMAAPLLEIIYPVLIIVVLYAMFIGGEKYWAICRWASMGAFIASAVLQLEKVVSIDVFSHILPLSGIGFGWILPAFLGGIIGVFIMKKAPAL